MPLYEYECKDGHKFEELRGLEGMHSSICPTCSKVAERKMSSFSSGFSQSFTTYGHDGRVLERKQITERTPMLPEKVHGGRF